MSTRPAHISRRDSPTRAGEHVTRAERAARGRALRSEVPRSAHGEFDPGGDRPDPIALLEEQAKTRVPELIGIRHGRMLVSPFTFYRGAALVMAHDLAHTPTTSLGAQLCGDAHLSNFGVFASPERRLVFDINDFDETLPGPFEWDVKRLGASVEVAGRDRGFSAAERRKAVLTCVKRYRTAMADFARMTSLEVFYASLNMDELVARYEASLPAKRVRQARRDLAKARTKDSHHAFRRFTHLVDGAPRIVSDAPLIVPVSELMAPSAAEEFIDWAQARLGEYRRTLTTERRHLLDRYRYADLARKVVGVGSVGTRAWILLLLGDDDDALVLQLKEAEPSVLERFAGRSEYRNAGHRVVAGQRLMQSASDIFLGWLRVTSTIEAAVTDYYVRQLRDWKGSADVEVMAPKSMELYAQLCGWALARAHARSGDPVALSAYLGRGDAFDRAIARFSEAYADQNERDHAALEAAVATGRLTVENGLSA